MKEVIHNKFCQCRCEEEVRLDVGARRILINLYDHLGVAVEDAANLVQHFHHKKDKRKKLAQKAVDAIIKAQAAVNPIAEDNDIELI